MNPVDSDLEEGEIVDDLPSLTYSNKEHRELPRRYVVHENGSPIHKHKRDCKYAIHGHIKKFTPLKKTQRSKNYRKRHRKSGCSREKYHKFSGKNSISTKNNFSKKDHSVSGLSLLSEIKKESLKENSIVKQSTKIVPKSQKDNSEAEKNKTNFTSEIGKVNADTQSENSSVKESRHQSLVSNTKDLSNLRKINPESDLKVSSGDASNNFSKVEHEESEDEEELRRIALATCAKRKAAVESSKNSFQTIESRDAVSVPESSEVSNVQTLHHEVTSPSDNYEVVDMEVDEDIEASIEVLAKSEKDQNIESTENLFVIDTKPTADSKDGEKQNTSSELKAIQNNSDDDFETDVLRAELIQSLYRKKSMQDECSGEDKLNINVHKKQVSNLPKKKHIGKYKKSNFTFYRRHHLKPGKHIIRKTIINKPAEVLSCNSSKPPSPIPVSKPPERLVIALNGSSSEDSADSESENPVASIEALISDCRQKSDSNEKAQETVTNVPKAVSCLSKAQQEEYTSLMKILAEKEKPQGQSDAFEHKNGSVRSVLNDLKLLQRKLLGFEENLKKKKDLEAYLLKDMSSKKLLYLKSKLTAHHLKEQYLAAEKVRKANLCTWSKSCSDLKTVQKSVSNLENKIIQLQDLCSRLGASVQGQTIDLPSLSIGNRQS